MLPTWIDWLVKDYGCPMKASPKHTPNVLSQNWHLATAKLLGFIDINSPWHRDYAHPALMSTPRIESNRRAWWYGNGLLNLVVLSLLKSDGIALKQLEAGKYHFCSVKALKNGFFFWVSQSLLINVSSFLNFGLFFIYILSNLSNTMNVKEYYLTKRPSHSTRTIF